MIINRNEVEEMIVNNDNFELKLTIELKENEKIYKCKNIFMSYENNKIDFTVDEWSNDEEIVSKVERLINYNKHYDLLNIIDHCTDIELLKKNDIITVNINEYIDKEQYITYDCLRIKEKLIQDYFNITLDCILNNNYILKEDIDERIQLLENEFDEVCDELNDYFITNFDNSKKYNCNSIKLFDNDKYSNRFKELKELLK